jgi:hypothetical protein
VERRAWVACPLFLACQQIKTLSFIPSTPTQPQMRQTANNLEALSAQPKQNGLLGDVVRFYGSCSRPSLPNGHGQLTRNYSRIEPRYHFIRFID